MRMHTFGGGGAFGEEGGHICTIDTAGAGMERHVKAVFTIDGAE